jgi:sterol 24-C-methyltransferase
MELDKKFPANHFDCAYAIEATCHAPDLTQCYAQVYKVLKPGGRLGLMPLSLPNLKPALKF